MHATADKKLANRELNYAAITPVTASSMPCRVDHNIKGQGIYAYVVLAEGTKPSPELKKKLSDVVRNQIGSFAVPDTIHWAPGNACMLV